MTWEKFVRDEYIKHLWVGSEPTTCRSAEQCSNHTPSESTLGDKMLLTADDLNMGLFQIRDEFMSRVILIQLKPEKQT